MIHTRVCILGGKIKLVLQHLQTIIVFCLLCLLFQIVYPSCEGKKFFYFFLTAIIYFHLALLNSCFERKGNFFFFPHTIPCGHVGLFCISLNHLFLHFHCLVHRSCYKSLLSSLFCTSSEIPLNLFFRWRVWVPRNGYCIQDDTETCNHGVA